MTGTSGGTQGGLVNGLLIQNICCKRAFIRGAFLSAGSMSDPEKSYHFEIVCTSEPKAEQLRDLSGAKEGQTGENERTGK